MASGGKNPKNGPNVRDKVVVSTVPKRHLPQKISVIVVLVVVVIAGIIVLVHENRQSYRACINADSGNLIKQAASYLNPVYLTQLKPIAQKIKTLPDYQKDPNCGYILTMYYINNNDYKNAQNSLNIFNTAYDKKSQLLSPSLTKFANVQYLRTTVNTLVKANSINKGVFVIQ